MVYYAGSQSYPIVENNELFFRETLNKTTCITELKTQLSRHLFSLEIQNKKSTFSSLIFIRNPK